MPLIKGSPNDIKCLQTRLARPTVRPPMSHVPQRVGAILSDETSPHAVRRRLKLLNGAFLHLNLLVHKPRVTVALKAHQKAAQLVRPKTPTQTPTISASLNQWPPRASGLISIPCLCPLGWVFPHCPREKVHSRAMNTVAHVAVRTIAKRPHTSG